MAALQNGDTFLSEKDFCQHRAESLGPWVAMTLLTAPAIPLYPLWDALVWSGWSELALALAFFAQMLAISHHYSVVQYIIRKDVAALRASGLLHAYDPPPILERERATLPVNARFSMQRLDRNVWVRDRLTQTTYEMQDPLRALFVETSFLVFTSEGLTEMKREAVAMELRRRFCLATTGDTVVRSHLLSFGPAVLADILRSDVAAASFRGQMF